MEGRIEADAYLDHVVIQILPTQNRYEAFLCRCEEVEKLCTGQLEQLLPHIPGLSDLCAKGYNANFKLQVKGELDDSSWFTKSTLNRFLQLVGSPDFLNSSKAIEAEMSQLEQAKNFHLSLYAQGHSDHFGGGGTVGCYNLIEGAPKLKPEGKPASSDSSKSELLQAMDLRLAALWRELDAALERATGAMCSSREITDLVKFCDHFEATDLKNALCKFVKLGQATDVALLQNNHKHSVAYMSGGETESNYNKAGSAGNLGSTYAVTPVKYGASPAMAAQVERCNSTESEESSCTSGENETSAKRSRARTVSAPARRSASPMRKVQIARTKSRRSPALTIKSLNYNPGKERCSRDGAASSSEGEGSEQPPNKKLGSKMRIMTVQDAINIFESKQKDQNEDVCKRPHLCNSSIRTAKPVLRRWSASVAECPTPCQRDLISEDSAMQCPSSPPCNVVTDSRGIVMDIQVEQSVSESKHVCQIFVKTTDTEVESCGEKADKPVDVQTDNKASVEHESNERLVASTEWIKQKESEFNQMVKIMELQDLKLQMPPKRNQHICSGQKGGLSDHYKDKRERKLRREHAGKRAENEMQYRAKKQSHLERKVGMPSSNVKDVIKEISLKKPHESLKNSSDSASPGNGSLKASVIKKVSSGTTTLPASRKSWPSMSSSKAAGLSPSKISLRNVKAGTTPTCQKPLLAPFPSQPSAEDDRRKPYQRNVKETQSVSNNSTRPVKERPKTVKTGEKAPKEKVAATGDCSGMVPPKSAFHGKMSKKSSVVPIESRPFIRKGSGASCGVGPTIDKKQNSKQLEKSATKGGSTMTTQEDQVIVNASTSASEKEQQDIVSVSEIYLAMETEKQEDRDESCGKIKNCNDLATEIMDGFPNVATYLAEVRCEEPSGISPTAWVESEMHEQQDLHHSNDDITLQPPSLVHVATVGLSTSRVRHSLSEMLQEDNSEPDTPEWGNAENPLPLFCQRDAPKGLKRLLKFSRKIKGDVNITEWSSPPVFNDGVDVTEVKVVSKRNTDYLHCQEALYSHDLQQEVMNAAESSAQTNLKKFDVQCTHKGHVSTAVPRTKAPIQGAGEKAHGLACTGFELPVMR